eukprot:452867-Amphidinium_carterae.1
MEAGEDRASSLNGGGWRPTLPSNLLRVEESKASLRPPTPLLLLLEDLLHLQMNPTRLNSRARILLSASPTESYTAFGQVGGANTSVLLRVQRSRLPQTPPRPFVVTVADLLRWCGIEGSSHDKNSDLSPTAQPWRSLGHITKVDLDPLLAAWKDKPSDAEWKPSLVCVAAGDTLNLRKRSVRISSALHR